MAHDALLSSMVHSSTVPAYQKAFFCFSIILQSMSIDPMVTALLDLACNIGMQPGVSQSQEEDTSKDDLSQET
jgi:hypothetical protein